jgi:hypothetical protein
MADNCATNFVREFSEAQLAVLGASSSPAPAVTFSSPSSHGNVDLAFDGSGNLWVANSGADGPGNTLAGNVLEFPARSLLPGGKLAPSAIVPVGGLANPTALAFDDAGDLWVADSGNGNVAEIPASDAPGTTSGVSYIWAYKAQYLAAWPPLLGSGAPRELTVPISSSTTSTTGATSTTTTTGEGRGTSSSTTTTAPGGHKVVPPKAPLRPVVGAATPVAHVSHGRFSLILRCARATCRGTVTIFRDKATWAKAAYWVLAGKSRVLRMGLKHACTVALARAKTHSVHVLEVVTVKGGLTVTRTLQLVG